MGTISSSFSLPVTSDRAVIAVQDTIDQLQWPVLESTATRVVAIAPKLAPTQMLNFPKLSVELREDQGKTIVSATISIGGPFWWTGGKKSMTGSLGQFVNSLSLRIQTNSIAINPTVAIGEGQGEAASLPTDAGARLSMLERLVDLHQRGVLTDDEFTMEKSRILGT